MKMLTIITRDPDPDMLSEFHDTMTRYGWQLSKVEDLKYRVEVHYIKREESDG